MTVLSRLPLRRVAAVAPGGVAVLVAQATGQLTSKACSSTSRVTRWEQPVRTDQVGPLGLGLLDQPRGELLIDRIASNLRRAAGLGRLGRHLVSPPVRHTAHLATELHRCSYSPSTDN